MNRRTALRTVGATALAVSAGCLGTAGPGGSDARRRVTIADADATPESIPATFAATVERATVTTDHTARVRIAFTNQADAATTYTFGDTPPFTTARSVESNPGILLLDPDETYDKPSPGCWRPADPPSIGSDGRAQQVTLDPDESIHRDVNLWGTPGETTDNCVPTGTFRFENRYQFEGTASFTWGFSVEITSP